jgi:CRP-like cAMP-binding protein
MNETLTLIEKTAFFKSVELLSSIPTEALAQLASRAQEILCEPGDVLFAEGEANRGTFLVVEGMIELRKGAALVRMLRERMVFGELFLDHDEPHQYTAIASQHSHVLNLETQDVIESMLDFPEFGVAVARSLALRNHRLTERVLEMEQLLAQFHQALREAGIDPPDREVAPPSPAIQAADTQAADDRVAAEMEESKASDGKGNDGKAKDGKAAR